MSENSTENEQVENLIIIGGGPAGYTAALYAARAEPSRWSSRASSGAASSKTRPTSRTTPATPRA